MATDTERNQSSTRGEHEERTVLAGIEQVQLWLIFFEEPSSPIQIMQLVGLSTVSCRMKSGNPGNAEGIL